MCWRLYRCEPLTLSKNSALLLQRSPRIFYVELRALLLTRSVQKVTGMWRALGVGRPYFAGDEAKCKGGRRSDPQT